MDYIDTVRLSNGKTIQRYWNYQPDKNHWLNLGGGREIVEIEIK